MAHRTPNHVKRRLAWLGFGFLIGMLTLGIRYLVGDSQNALSAAVTVLIPTTAAFFASLIPANGSNKT